MVAKAADIIGLYLNPPEMRSSRRAPLLGAFPALEDQMCAFTTDFDRANAGYSPDRVDALVWAFTDLLVEQMPNEGIYEWTRRQAVAVVNKTPNPASSVTPSARSNT